jgi:hypothetical protein
VIQTPLPAKVEKATLDGQAWAPTPQSLAIANAWNDPGGGLVAIIMPLAQRRWPLWPANRRAKFFLMQLLKSALACASGQQATWSPEERCIAVAA